MISEQVPAEEVSAVRRLLASLVSTVCRFPRTVLAVSLLLCALSVYAASAHLQYHTQRNDLISPRKEYQQRWRQYLTEFGDDDDIVVVVKGGERARMQQALEVLAEQVRQRSDLFDRLFYKVDLRHLRDRALLFLPHAEIASIQENLRGMGLLLEFGPISWSGLTLLSLFQEANQRVAKMTPGQALAPADDQFLTQLRAISSSAREILADPAAYRNPWSSLLSRPPEQKDLLADPQYFFSGDGTLAFLLTRPVKEKGSFTAALKSVNAMRDIVAQTRPQFPEIEFGLTGLPVLETDEMAAAEHDTRLASWLAILGVSALFILVYRGICYPLLTVATLLIGTAWAMGWLTLTVGHLNILSATFAVMLIGMGDYGVLWVMRYEQARRRGLDVRDALLHTTTHVAVGNLTAATTLALAFFAAILADFQAVAELGWIAGCGVLLCALACFTVLPSILMVLDRRGPLGPRPGEPVKKLAPFDPRRRLPPRPTLPDVWLPVLGRRPVWVLGVGLALFAVIGACAPRVPYDHNLLHLQARNLDSVKWELTLIEHTAGASWHALSYTSTPEQALALKAKYEQLPEVSRVVEVASLVPAGQEAKVQILGDIQTRLRNLPQRGATIPHVRPHLPDLRIEVARLIGHLQPLVAAGSNSDKPSLLADLRQSLVGLHRRLERMPVVAVAEICLQDFEQRLAGDLAEDLHRLREVARPAPITLDDLPVGLRERYLGHNGKWLLRVFAKESLWDFEPLEHFCQQIRTVDEEATGKPFGTVEGLKAMKNGLQNAGVYAFGVIVLVLLLDFRSLKNTLIAVAPLVMGVSLTLGVMGLFGVALNPANMIAFPLILGVGVDNGVHVLHDYVLRRAAGQTGISYAIGRGVLVKALTTMIGFGTLMISTERGLAGLGFILTLGVGCSMVTALVLLPALLHLLGGRQAPAALGIQVEPQRQAA
jgi:hopanoid biosynthesis associated RND transporter like protein HpnN